MSNPDKPPRTGPSHAYISKQRLSVPRRQLVDLIQSTANGSILLLVDQGEPVFAPRPTVKKRYHLTGAPPPTRPSQGDMLKASLGELFTVFDGIHQRTPVFIQITGSVPVYFDVIDSNEVA
jgi:hypothetical protein